MPKAAVLERLDKRFELWDTDNNGQINGSDFQVEAVNLVKAFNEDANSPRGHAVTDAFNQLWEFLAGKAGVGASGSLSREQFAEVAQREIVDQADSGFSKALRPTIRAIIDLLDADGDEKINPSEFKKWLEVIGVPQSEADAAFSSIDVNRDGYLDADELVQAVRQYHLGENDIPLLGR